MSRPYSCAKQSQTLRSCEVFNLEREDLSNQERQLRRDIPSADEIEHNMSLFVIDNDLNIN